jgi:hypothetical protein
VADDEGLSREQKLALVLRFWSVLDGRADLDMTDDQAEELLSQIARAEQGRLDAEALDALLDLVRSLRV